MNIATETLVLALSDLKNPTIRHIAKNLCDEASGEDIIRAVETLREKTLTMSLPILIETLRMFATPNNKIARIKWLRMITAFNGSTIGLKTAKDVVEFIDPPKDNMFHSVDNSLEILAKELSDMGWLVIR